MRRLVPGLAVIASFLLSGRLVAAGDVVAIAKGGALTLAGSAGGEVVTLDTAAVNQVRVTPGAGTTVNGVAAPEILTVTGKVTVDLGAGDDDLTLDAVPIVGGLKIKMGDGTDRVHLVGVNIDGVTKIDLGAGAGSFAFCGGSSEKKLDVKTGLAAPGAAATSCDGIDNTALDAPGGIAVAIGNVQMRRGLGLKTKGGLAKVIAYNSGVTGKASLAFGDGAVAASVCDTNVNGDLSVKMKAGIDFTSIECVLANLDGSLTGPHLLLLLASTVTGKIGMKGGKDGDYGSLLATTVGKDVKFDLGPGDNAAIVLEGTIGGGLVAKGGKGNDLVRTSALTVAKSVKLTLGDGRSDVAVKGTTITGDLVIKTGKDEDVIDTTTTTVGGKTTIKHGDGNDTVVP